MSLFWGILAENFVLLRFKGLVLSVVISVLGLMIVDDEKILYKDRGAHGAGALLAGPPHLTHAPSSFRAGDPPASAWSNRGPEGIAGVPWTLLRPLPGPDRPLQGVL